MDIGKFRRHRGIWNKWITNKNGSMINKYIDHMARKIVEQYEELMHGAVKEWILPEYWSIKLTKLYDEEAYRSVIGKIMYPL